MKITSIVVQIEKGRIKPKSEHHEALIERFFQQFEGKEVRLEVTEKKSKRSEEQNRYLWLYYNIISAETGYTPLEIHEWAKSACLPTEVKEIFGDKTRIKKSTTALTKGEMVEFIINIESKTGIPSPDTTQYFGYSYHK